MKTNTMISLDVQSMSPFTHGTNIKQEQPDLDIQFMKTEEDYELYPTDPLAICTPNQIEGSIIKPQTEGLSAQISPKQEAVGASIKLEKIKEEENGESERNKREYKTVSILDYHMKN